MKGEFQSGFFRDDGTEINPDPIVKPSLCEEKSEEEKSKNRDGSIFGDWKAPAHGELKGGE